MNINRILVLLSCSLSFYSPIVSSENNAKLEMGESKIRDAAKKNNEYTGKKIIKIGKVAGGDNLMETTLIHYKKVLLRLENLRPLTPVKESKELYLEFVEVATGKRLGRFAEGYGLADVIVYNNKAHVFASKFDIAKNMWGNFVTMFVSADLQNWEETIVFRTEDVPNESIFNVGIAKGPGKYWVMVYETNDHRYTAFTMKFAHSYDLKTFNKSDVPFFRTDKYTGAPALSYDGKHYYFFFAERIPHQPLDIFETRVARSRDFKKWEYGKRPVLTPSDGELNCNSDITFIELNGTTLVYYADADQVETTRLAMAIFSGTQKQFLQSFFD